MWAMSSSEFTRSYEAIADALVVWVNMHLFPKLRSRVEADDVIQEVWCRAYQRFKTFDPERGSFRAWVVGIAEKVLLEELRGLGRASPRTTSELPAVQSLVAEITSISERAARNEHVRHLLEEAARLPEEDRQLLLYRGLEGQTYEEVSKRLGIGAEAARSRWRRLREQLRGLMEDTSLLADAGQDGCPPAS
jgi:RNA polymerase sigma-70 factor (ECF subfamily)